MQEGVARCSLFLYHWARKYIDGKRVTVGTFDTLEEARDAIKGYTNA